MAARAFLAAYTLFVLFPIVWLFLSSLKSRYESLVIPPRLVFSPTFEAYAKILSGGMLDSFRNSLAIGVANVTLALVLGIPAAYGLVHIGGKLRENLSLWILSIRMAPAFGLLVPLYTLMRYLRLLDTVVAVVLTHLTMTLPLAVWLLLSHFRDIPQEVEEAARIDGATRWQTLAYVVLPLSKPMLVGVGVLAFLLSWNEFMFAFVLSSSQARTVPVLVASLAGTMAFDWPLMSAVGVGATIPAFGLLFFVQRYIVRGLTLGAVR